MGWGLYITPFIAAVLGWLFVTIALRALFHPVYPKKTILGILHGIIPKRQQEIAEKIGQFSASMLSLEEIEKKITNPENVKKIMPHAEAHIDDFLRVKLVKSMPMIGMFVGDKTINSLKSLFVAELEQLFPEIMKNYMGGLQEDFNIEKMVTSKIAAIPPREIEKVLLDTMKKELRLIKLYGALLGFVIGWIQVGIILFLLK